MHMPEILTDCRDSAAILVQDGEILAAGQQE